MTINTNSSRLFRPGGATGLVLLLTVIGLSPVAEAATWWIKRDWSKVQRIASGARTRVRLYKDRAPGGIERVEGQFQSASTGAIILLLADGQTVTVQKQAVKKVLVYRPIKKRYQGWVTLGVFFRIVGSCRTQIRHRAVRETVSQQPLHRSAHRHSILGSPPMGRYLHRAAQTP